MDSGSEPPHSDGDASPRATAPETAAHDGQVTLFGRYRIERELGRGGMGRVLLAFDTHLDTFVAVKLLPDVSAASAEAIENLRREVRRGMVLTHPGIARTHKEAMAMFNKTNPRMILADIQLADGSSGIDAVNDMLSSRAIPVIFITAFPERLLTGERPEPTFLVTKPFNPDMVKALISQALFFNEGARAAA